MQHCLVDSKKDVRFEEWSTAEVHPTKFTHYATTHTHARTHTPTLYPFQIDVLNKHLFLTSKPVIYLVNLSEKDYIRKKNKWLVKIKEWVDAREPGCTIIPFSGALEAKVTPATHTNNTSLSMHLLDS